MVCRSWPYGVVPYPWNRRCSNISSPIPLKPEVLKYINILKTVCWPWPYGMVPSPLHQRCCNILKTVEIPLNHIYSCSLSQGAFDVCWSRPYGMVPSPLHQKCCNILKTVEIPIHRPYIFLFLVSGNRWWNIIITIRGGPMDAPILNRKCPNISKTVEISHP
jgi:hypothetical protein